MRVRLQSSLSGMQYSDYRRDLRDRKEQIAKSPLREYPRGETKGS
jgi:hypothetical protein